VSWEDEFDTFARERGPALVGYGYLLTGELHAAQDLVQDAFVRTFARHRAGGDAEKIEAYVRQAMLNVYRDSYRKRRTWFGVRPLVAERAAYGPPDAVAAARIDVHSALARLSPRERTCVVLRHYEDLTVPEIATRLNLSEGAVKRYLSDARARLGPMLAEGADQHVDVVTRKETER
jgi:RNA polymerase sigma-70 factor (sigma-E family)